MSNSTIITLLSDLGTGSTSVTMAKALLLNYAPGAAIIDISHHVALYDRQQAAFLLLTAYKHFPAGTVNMLMIDVFTGGLPKMVVAEKDGSFFIAPDNGVLPLAFGAETGTTRLCFEFVKPYTFNDWINNAGKVIAAIRSGSVTNFATCEIKQAQRIMQPRMMPGGVECNILYVDRYENIVLDITRAQFDEMVGSRPFKISILRMEICTISNNYSDVKRDEPLCRFNSAGFMEIAVNHALAATSLGFGSFSTGHMRYQTIKIRFQDQAGV